MCKWTKFTRPSSYAISEMPNSDKEISDTLEWLLLQYWEVSHFSKCSAGRGGSDNISYIWSSTRSVKPLFAFAFQYGSDHLDRQITCNPGPGELIITWSSYEKMQSYHLRFPKQFWNSYSSRTWTECMVLLRPHEVALADEKKCTKIDHQVTWSFHIFGVKDLVLILPKIDRSDTLFACSRRNFYAILKKIDDTSGSVEHYELWNLQLRPSISVASHGQSIKPRNICMKIRRSDEIVR